MRRIFPFRKRGCENKPVYAAQYLEHNIPSRAAAGSTCVFRVLVRNAGTAAWHRVHPEGHAALLAMYVNGELVTTGQQIPQVISPGEKALIALTVTLPQEAGKYRLKMDMIIQQLALFEERGGSPLELNLELYEREKSHTEALLRVSRRHNSWFFSPSQGVHLSGDRSTYPVFASSAKGCCITDVEGKEFVDLLMGWGSCLLGYADDRIQQAIAASLNSSGILSLPHRLEMEVSEMLCSLFPSADEVLFGKNGSDVTTAAVRTARSLTGRKTILFSGYHGWQDWAVASQGFAVTGVLPEAGNNVVQVPYRNMEVLEESASAHASDLAAIMVEPAHMVVDLGDPYHEGDVPFLKTAEKLAKRHGALFILDEIMTGFRFRTGSAQRAFGLHPDLTCLGKALSNGMPLSALLGRGDILRQAVYRIHYNPTFKGEIHSFAAALASLKIHQAEDIPARIWRLGEELRARVNNVCHTLELDAALVGPPYRMYLAFPALEDEQQKVLTRTLLQQELARNGVICHQGFAFISTQHNQVAIETCTEAFSRTLGVLREAWKENSMIRHLEVPDVMWI